MREAKRKWIFNGKPRDTNNKFYCDYKQRKCDFRRHHRNAERQWNREKYIEITAASEVDI
jgi:hypothetical protein